MVKRSIDVSQYQGQIDWELVKIILILQSYGVVM